MNLAKSKVVLKKINTLYESLELGEEVSKIEKDLLIDYVKELYESVLEISSKKEKKNKKSFEQVLKKKEKSIEKNQKVDVDIVEEVKEKKLELVEAEMDEMKPEIPSSNGTHAIAAAVAPTPVPSKPVVPVIKVSQEIEDLFDPSILDKSDYRFSQTPITDITKAMGINERLLMINLLFNKDNQDFNYVATKLNYFNSFDEASQYLKTEVAGKYDWSSANKKEKAIEFIKLIKRKYIS